MKRLFIGLTVASLATMLVPVSVHASALALDAAGNLFAADGHSISKHAPDGKKSTFAKGIDAAVMGVDCADVEEAVRENLDEAFGAHFLVTLKFDPQGSWKIVNTHRMSQKGVEKKDKEQ